MAVELIIEDFDPSMLTGEYEHMGTGRSAGMHLSQVLQYMRVATGELRGDMTNDNFAKVGFLMEQPVARYLQADLQEELGELTSCGELEMDGIFMTPDRVAVDAPAGETLVEIKVTWKSLRDLETKYHEKFWHYTLQLMGYCKGLGLTRALLVPLFIDGDYSRKPPDGGPRFKKLWFEFSQEELDANWRVVLQHAKDLRRQQAEAAKLERDPFHRIRG